jgi:AcrR family transcriptional regulator
LSNKAFARLSAATSPSIRSKQFNDQLVLIQKAEVAPHTSTGVIAIETRDRIVKAAANSFATVGFRFSTINDIASDARVNQCTIYHYFNKKSELYWEAVDSALREAYLRERFSLAISRAVDPADLIQELASEVRQIRQSNPNLERLIYFTALELDAERKLLFRLYLAPLFAMLVDRIREWIHKKLVRPVHPKMAASAIVGMLFAQCNLTNLLDGEERVQLFVDTEAEYASYCTEGLTAKH